MKNIKNVYGMQTRKKFSKSTIRQIFIQHKHVVDYQINQHNIKQISSLEIEK